MMRRSRACRATACLRHTDGTERGIATGHEEIPAVRRPRGPDRPFAIAGHAERGLRSRGAASSLPALPGAAGSTCRGAQERPGAPMGGLNLTVPLKETVLPLLDAITPEARRIG